MKKIIAIASADWHIHKFQAFDKDGSRLKWAIKAAEEIMLKALELKVPLLFAGDLIHSPKNIETETNIEVQSLFRYKTQVIAISGNHDFCQRNGFDFVSPSHLDAIQGANMTTLDHAMHGWDWGNFVIWGIDYMNNDLDLKKAIEHIRPSTNNFKNKTKILMLHSDLPGAKTPEGFILKEAEHIPHDLDKFFKNWDLVLCGHIHSPQKLGSKTYMLGCPIQQNEANIGRQYGYWKIFIDGTVKFVPMDNYPKFIRLKEGEKPIENSIDYYIMPDEVLVEEDVEIGAFSINLSKSKLARRYVAHRQIKSKSKTRALIKILNESE